MIKISAAKILLIDDDPTTSWIIKRGLNGAQYEARITRYIGQGMQIINEFEPDVVLLNIRMAGHEGIRLLKYVKKLNHNMCAVITAEVLNSPLVIEAIREGGEDFLLKPFDSKILELFIQRILERKKLQQGLQHLEEDFSLRDAKDHFIGESPQIVQIKQKISQVALTDLNVLLCGASGTGKEVVARLIHSLSPRHNGPFIKVNCAALPQELLESELFGHEKGAFTGAYKSKPGRFELGEQGTVFLDEIGELPSSLQAKLLQVLEHKEFFRVGGTKPTKVDVRLISATNIEIEKKVAEKNFRPDLYYRLADVQITLPLLSERREDIPLLIDHFLLQFCTKYNKTLYPLSQHLLQKLISYHWPGNCRELESLIKRVVLFGEEEIVKHLDLSGSGVMQESVIVKTPPVSVQQEKAVVGSLKSAVAETKSVIEKRSILEALTQARWNRKKAAQALGISYRTLLYKIQRYKLNGEDNIDTEDSSVE